MKKLLVILSFIAPCVAAFAQEEEPAVIPAAETQTRLFSGNCNDHPVLKDVRMDPITGKVFVGKRRASTGEVINMMALSSPELFQKRASGKRMMVGGIVLSGTGGGLLIFGSFFMFLGHVDTWDREYWDDEEYDHHDNGLWKAGVVLASVGATELAVGVPLTIIGAKKKRKALMEFKQNCIGEEFFNLENQNQYQLNLNINQNGLGLALTF